MKRLRQVMKPLPRCSSTLEDLDIWLAVMQRWRMRYGAKAMARFDLNVYAGDRRDADLMLRVMRVRAKYEGLRAWVRDNAGWAPLGAHSILIGAQTRGLDLADAFNITCCA